MGGVVLPRRRDRREVQDPDPAGASQALDEGERSARVVRHEPRGRFGEHAPTTEIDRRIGGGALCVCGFAAEEFDSS